MMHKIKTITALEQKLKEEQTQMAAIMAMIERKSKRGGVRVVENGRSLRD